MKFSLFLYRLIRNEGKGICRVPAGSPAGGQFDSCGGGSAGVTTSQISSPSEGKKILQEFEKTYSTEKKTIGYEYTKGAIEKSVSESNQRNVFVSRGADGKIGAAMATTDRPGAVEISVLGSMRKGHGTAMVQKAVQESQKKGYGGNVTVFSLRSSVGFYIDRGFDLHPNGSGDFLLTGKMAREMGYVK